MVSLTRRIRPPFVTTPKILAHCAEILRLVGRHEGLMSPRPQPQLRRRNRIRSIQGSLAIEGNTLSEDQVTAILEHRRVAGPRREILEVQNAIATYDRAATFDPAAERDLLAAHGLMMEGLADDAGRYRRKGVGVLRGRRVTHLAPPPRQVPRLMGDLLKFLRTDRETHPLIKSAVFHYELEFIHPFSDGNGRLGRLWQHVILLRIHPVFEFLPVESVIRSEQRRYYRALGASDKAGASTAFVEFSLETIRQAFEEFAGELRPEAQTGRDRLQVARGHFSDRPFSRKDYLALFRRLSTATASRDLKDGVDRAELTRSGDKSTSTYRFDR